MSEESEKAAAEKDAAPASGDAAPETKKVEGTTTQHVGMDDETQKRFNRVYGNMKQYERVTQQMGKENKALLNRLDDLESTVQGDRQIEAVQRLSAAKVQALDEGDHEAVVVIDNQLAQLNQPAPARGPAPQPEAGGIQSAISQLPPEEAAAIAAWGFEKTTSGEWARPWAQPGHPYNAKAANIGAAVLQDQDIVGQGTEAVLAEVDRLMGNEMTPLARPSPVLNSGGRRGPAPGQAKELTADEKLIAKAMDISPERYLKSKQEIVNG